MAGVRAIREAAIAGDLAGVIRWLHDNPGTSPDLLNSNGQTHLLMAYAHRQRRVAMVLLSAGADGNFKRWENDAPVSHRALHSFL